MRCPFDPYPISIFTGMFLHFLIVKADTIDLYKEPVSSLFPMIVVSHK